MARPKKYKIKLTDDELKEFKSVIRKNKTSKTIRCRCQIIIDLDESHGKVLTHEQSAKSVSYTHLDVYKRQTKQCVAAWLVLSGMINVMILFLIAGYLNYHWRVGLLQVGLYILTPYLVSSITALGILSMETRGKNSSLFGMSAIFLSISYGVIGSIPRALFVTTLWIWAVAFLVSGLLFVMQIKKLLSKMEKGEVLCTN